MFSDQVNEVPKERDKLHLKVRQGIKCVRMCVEHKRWREIDSSTFLIYKQRDQRHKLHGVKCGTQTKD